LDLTVGINHAHPRDLLAPLIEDLAQDLLKTIPGIDLLPA
jgi:hypothetical protein